MEDAIRKEDAEQAEEKKLFEVIASGEKMLNFTESENGFELTVKYKLPTLKQKNTAEMLYSKSFSRMLRDNDYMTTKELMHNAKERGIWSDGDELRLTLIDEEIIGKKRTSKNRKNKKKKEQHTGDLANLRQEKFTLALRVGQITGNAIETLAERERTIYMLLNCVFVIDDEGKEHPMYTSREDIEEERDLKKLEQVLMNGRSFWSGEGITDFLHLGD